MTDEFDVLAPITRENIKHTENKFKTTIITMLRSLMEKINKV